MKPLRFANMTLSNSETTDSSYQNTSSCSSRTDSTVNSSFNLSSDNDQRKTEKLLINILLDLGVSSQVMENLVQDGYIGEDYDQLVGDLPSYLEGELPEGMLNSHGTAACYLNHFTLEETISSGGFGVVVRCKHNTDKKSYAIKIIPIKKEKDKNKYIKEVDILSKLEHENIVRYYQSFIEHSIPPDFKQIMDSSEYLDQPIENYDFLIIQMELCSSLEKQCGNLQPNQARFYLRQILNGLSYLHKEKKITHGDIKPNNIFILEDKIKIGDFGLSCENSQTPKTTGGTKRYQDEKNAFTPQGDIYALGITFFELMSNFVTISERYEQVASLCKDPSTFAFPHQFQEIDKKLVIGMISNSLTIQELIDILDKCRFTCLMCNMANIVGISKMISHEQSTPHQGKITQQLPVEPVQALIFISTKFNKSAPTYKENTVCINNTNHFTCSVSFDGHSYESNLHHQKKPAKNEAAANMVELVREEYENLMKSRCEYVISM